MVKCSVIGALLALVPAAGIFAPALADVPAVQVFKSPTCGCCAAWVKHLEDNGFAVHVTDHADMSPIKRQYGVPPRFSSCHTALVAGYIVEGHVPAGDIMRLLRERPEIRGLAVPGMPVGAPGMEGANPESYDVLALDEGGDRTVFATHHP